MGTFNLTKNSTVDLRAYKQTPSGYNGRCVLPTIEYLSNAYCHDMGIDHDFPLARGLSLQWWDYRISVVFRKKGL